MTPSPRNLVLIGYRGVGKTTLARLLAAALGDAWRAVDSDDLIEARAGKSIARIFADDGEPAFRDLEAAVIGQLSAGEHVVLATGGGAVLREANRTALRTMGPIVWLQATPETIQQRLQADAATADRRPSLTILSSLDEIRSLLAARAPLYAELANVTIDADRRPTCELVAEILQQLAALRPKGPPA